MSAKVFSGIVYQQIQRPYQHYMFSGFLGLFSNFLFGRMHQIHGFIQGALYLKQVVWQKAMVFLLGAGIASAFYFFVITQMLKVQWLFASVMISCFGIVATFVFTSDLYRKHGQRFFYFGVMLLGFAWINNVHQYWSEEMAIEGAWFWINQNLLLVLLFSAVVSMFLQTSFIAGVIALSLLHLNMISFDAALAMFFGGYIGSPIGTLLVYAKAEKEGQILQLLHCMMRFIVTGVSLVWIKWFSQSSALIFLQKTELLVLMFFAIQVLLLGLYWPFHERVYQALKELFQQETPHALDPYRLFANQPALCFEVAKSYVLEMGNTVRQMLQLLCEPFVEESRDAMIKMDEQYDQVEQMARQINFYLAKINLEELSYFESQRETHWFQISHAFKNISSFMNRNIMEIAGQVKERGIVFDAELWQRVQACHAMLLDNFDRMLANIADEDPEILKASYAIKNKFTRSKKRSNKRTCKKSDPIPILRLKPRPLFVAFKSAPVFKYFDFPLGLSDHRSTEESLEAIRLDISIAIVL
ncbi:MAG: hypothetical protein R3A45_06650 [Bdellovibrionota bacterium]